MKKKILIILYIQLFLAAGCKKSVEKVQYEPIEKDPAYTEAIWFCTCCEYLNSSSDTTTFDTISSGNPWRSILDSASSKPLRTFHATE